MAAVSISGDSVGEEKTVGEAVIARNASREGTDVLSSEQAAVRKMMLRVRNTKCCSTGIAFPVAHFSVYQCCQINPS
jgi:hypothetical protein